MDRHQLSGTPGGEKRSGYLIRRATPDDVPWLVAGAKALFSNIEEKAATAFLMAAICDQDTLILRGEQSAIGVTCYRWPYNPSLIMAEDMFIGSFGEDMWELMAVFKEMCRVLQAIGVSELKFDLSEFSKTGKSLEPFARRLGAAVERPTYRINFKKLH